MRTSPFVRLSQALLACTTGVLALLAIPAHAETSTIAARTQRTYTVTAGNDATVLVIEGRYIADIESWPQTTVRLYLNGTLLTGERMLNATPIVTPNNQKATFPLMSRYSANDRCFAFKPDQDYLEGNGPYAWNDVEYNRVTGCPPLLQLQVKDLVKPGENQLLVINGARLPLELRRQALLPSAVPVDDAMVEHPSWVMFAQSDALAGRYRQYLKTAALSPADRAYLLTSLGTGEVNRANGTPAQAVADWRAALAASTDFDLAGEAAYRLAAERQRTGHWPDAETEAQVRRAARSDGSWQGLANAMLDVIDGKTTSTARPLIHPLQMADAPVVDGKLTETCWLQSPPYAISYYLGDEEVAEHTTTVQFASTNAGLALAFRGKLPKNYDQKTGIRRDENVWDDNCVECFLATTDLRVYYEMNASAFGGQFDGRNQWWWNTDSRWNGDWQMASQLQGLDFTIEYFIPWSDLGFTKRPASGTVLVTAIGRMAEEQRDGRRVVGTYALTKHRQRDMHRIMDGALIIIP